MGVPKHRFARSSRHQNPNSTHNGVEKFSSRIDARARHRYFAGRTRLRWGGQSESRCGSASMDEDELLELAGRKGRSASICAPGFSSMEAVVQAATRADTPQRARRAKPATRSQSARITQANKPRVVRRAESPSLVSAQWGPRAPAIKIKFGAIFSTLKFFARFLSQILKLHDVSFKWK